MLKNISSTLVLTFIVTLGMSYAARSQEIRMVIKEDLAKCTGVGPMTCMQVKYKSSKSWELFYSQISGFNYKSGYRYVILVNRTKKVNVPADASAYEYKLIKIIKKLRMKENTTTAWDFVLKHRWRLIQMNGVVQSASPVYLTFDGDEKRVSGKSGCNTFFGEYNKSHDQLTFKQMAGTMMACSPELNKLEHEFLSVLGNKKFKYDVADQTLNLYQNNKLVLMFGLAPLK